MTRQERQGSDGGRNGAADEDVNVNDDAEFLRAQARKCRWLADRVNSPDVVRTLLQMAQDYEARADRPKPNEPPSSA
ncbi:MAG TPA: hypothetical protein VH331_08610 [Allosphingosinicella sp.]|nr:hypothetical protein [Allosphingosinicella sp.]